MSSDVSLSDLKRFFDSQSFAVLSTKSKDYPHSNFISFVSSPDLKSIFFVTNRISEKYKNIERDSKVSILIDNRSNSLDDFEKALVVTALGKARKVTDSEKEEISDLYLSKNPHLEDFLKCPSCELMEIRVDKYIVVDRFQFVIEVNIDEQSG